MSDVYEHNPDKEALETPTIDCVVVDHMDPMDHYTQDYRMVVDHVRKWGNKKGFRARTQFIGSGNGLKGEVHLGTDREAHDKAVAEGVDLLERSQVESDERYEKHRARSEELRREAEAK